MKTKALIAILRREDPTGEMEVCVEGTDIGHVEKKPYGYDGAQEILVRSGNEIVGAKITSQGGYDVGGMRLVIATLSVEDALVDNPDLPVEITPPDPRVEAQVEKWRREARGT
jgi:hypothetical protein